MSPANPPSRSKNSSTPLQLFWEGGRRVGGNRTRIIFPVIGIAQGYQKLCRDQVRFQENRPASALPVHQERKCPVRNFYRPTFLENDPFHVARSALSLQEDRCIRPYELWYKTRDEEVGAVQPPHRRSRAPLRRNTPYQNPFPVHFTCSGPEKTENPCPIGNI